MTSAELERTLDRQRRDQLEPPRRDPRSPGTQFVESEGFDFFRRGGHHASGTWESPAIEVYAGPIGDPPIGPIPFPFERQPVRPLVRPPTVASLFAQGRTTANAILYPVEVSYDVSYPGWTTAPGVAKLVPSETVMWQLMTAPVVKVAGIVPLTEEFFEDLPGLAAYIDAKLLRAVDRAVDLYLYNIVLPAGLVLTRDPAQSNAQALLAAAARVFARSGYVPDAIVMDVPTFFATPGIAGQEMAGSRLFENNGVTNAAEAYLCGMRLMPALSGFSGAMVGAFAEAGQIFWRDEFAIQVSNSHADDFAYNRLMLRGERRCAWAFYRNDAFCRVANLIALP